MAEKKEKHYIIENAQLMSEWDWEKNNDLDLDPKLVLHGSTKKAWWKCSKGHEWQAGVYSRSIGSGCPYCTNRKVLKGFNDLQTLKPTLASEWDYEKNYGLTPADVVPNSNKSVWWICSKGHSWKASVNTRNAGRGCPVCASKIVLKGYNDLKTTNPQLAEEWHPEKNGALTPEDVAPGTHKKAWWKCKLGHEWQASIANRNNGNGCPYCAGQRVIPGETDLETKDSVLAQEWLVEENLPLTAKTVSWKSNQKVWWQCPACAHKWQAKIVNRTNGRGCPKCNSRKQTSFPEQAIFYYIVTEYPDAINRYKAEFLKGMELDIYIPSKKVAIEYDGVAWHTSVSSQEREKRKHSICKSRGIFLIRVKEQIKVDDNCDALIATDYDNLNFRELDRVVSELSRYIQISSRIDTERDKRTIQLQFLTNKKAKSILHLHPEIAATWNTSKNGELTPEMFSPGSTDKVWWKCSICGNEWETRIDHRCAGAGCPICSMDEAMRRRNSNYINKNGSLADHHPELVAEWNYAKNGELTPQDILSGSNQKVWWKCKNGHEWQATIASRTKFGAGCAVCSGKRILPGYNDLATLNPKLLEEWDFERNKLKPTEVGLGSHKKVWWVGECGHKWNAAVSSRAKGSNCPYCSNHKILVGYNDLATTNPDLASEWHPTLNGALKPTDITAGSEKKVWWYGDCGHEWQSIVYHRNKGVGCPICSKEKLKKKD